MEGLSKESIFNHVRKELFDLAEIGTKLEQEMEDKLEENLTFLRCMVSQAGTNDGPLMPKTPKAKRKNTVQRIETIHEDESVEFETTRAENIAEEDTDAETKDEDATSNRRSRRTASRKASTNIKQQQLANLKDKLRRPENGEENDEKTYKKERRSTSSSEDESQRPVRTSRAQKLSIQKKTVKEPESETQDNTFVVESGKKKESSLLGKEARASTSKRKHDETRSPSPKDSHGRRSSRISSDEPAAKKANVIDESMEKSSLDNTLESSVYEDAIGRPAPIHNSTKIIDTTLILEPKSGQSDPKSKEFSSTLKPKQHTMNVTVVLEPLSKHTKTLAVEDQDDMEDVDMVDCTPEVKNMTRGGLQGLRVKVPRAGKNTVLFSPYATDSVRKRVEAFEQVGLNSPKPPEVEVDAPTRITRTKTRAMAAAAASENSAQTAQPVLSITQKLARKSLARAKKISLAKQTKDTDDGKENDNSIVVAPQKTHRLLAIHEKLLQRQQLKVTPIGKSRLPQPMSVNRLQVTPSNTQPLSTQSRAMSVSRTNIITNMDSFIQSTKQSQKSNLSDKLEEKRRKANEEDARRKKDEALKALTVEKKRKREQKEQKNKLAREAKEKLDQEKRLKAEKEREEKARIAWQIQEKQREELEKKRLHQLQRAQEKEERRKQEEQLRQQRLQEQEEMERQLAEQKRKEQEAAEKAHQRRLAEAKAQQQALAEAAKIKAQYQAKQAKLLNNTHTVQKQAPGPTSYKIESEPDEDDDASDTEDAPKHAVPSWANAHARREQLVLQKYVPPSEVRRYFDSRRCTPDLTKIFEHIDRRRLQRTSSAIWKTPPRYSMMFRE